MRRGVRAAPPAGAVRLDADPEGDAAHLLARALPRRWSSASARRCPTSRSRPTSSSGSRARPRPTSPTPSRWSTWSATTTRSRSSTRRGAGTEAARMPDQVPEDVRGERIERLVDRIQHHAAARNAQLVGTVQEVLVEGPSRTDPAILRGRTRGGKALNFTGDGGGRVARRRHGHRLDLADALGPPGRARRRLDPMAVIAIFGPTASGKSAVALELADMVGGEIVSCDAMQLYRGLPILTNQPSAADRERVAHHLVGVWEPSHEGSVAEYAELAHAAVDDDPRPRPRPDRVRRERPLHAGGARRHAAPSPGTGRRPRRRRAPVRRAWAGRRRTPRWRPSMRLRPPRSTRTTGAAWCARWSSRSRGIRWPSPRAPCGRRRRATRPSWPA